jgi:tRNA threonylcarbamoyladenosine biosynthesis protein TsaE
VRTTSAGETEAVGEALAALLVPGDVVLLEGDLGAGKTTFVRGLARGLGVVLGVKSPTFAIHLSYPGRLAVHHLDLYRIGPGDLAELGLEDVLGRDGVAVIEWGERLGEAAPSTALRIRLEEEGPSQRRLRIEGPQAAIAACRSALPGSLAVVEPGP